MDGKATSDGVVGARPLDKSIWTELHSAHRTLSQLSHSSGPCGLHGFSEATNGAVGSSSQTAKDSHLSHEQYNQMISNLRSTVKQFRSSVATLSEATSDQTNINRYHGLLKERSQHVSRLHTAQDPLLQLQSSLKKRTQEAIPAKLYIGALSDGAESSIITQGKRKRDEGEATTLVTTQDAAIAAVATFSTVLEDVAKELRLETFAEAVNTTQDVFAEDVDVLHTHTLTIGGRLLVLDLDLGLRGAVPRHIQPSVKLKLSFTTDASHGDEQGASEYRIKLTQCLENDARAILGLIFGDPVELNTAAEQDVDEVRLRLAKAHYVRLRLNLERLANIDHQSVVSDVAHDAQASSTAPQPLDLFHVNQTVCGLIEGIARIEQQRLSESPNAAKMESTDATALLRFGHGLPFAHAGFVGLTIVYDVLPGENALRDALSSVHKSKKLYTARIETVIGSYGLQRPADVQAAVKEPLTASDLSTSLPAQGLTHIAHLDPPVVLSRQGAARLREILGWETDEDKAVVESVTKGKSWIGNVLRGNYDATAPIDPPTSSGVCLELVDYAGHEDVPTREEGLVVNAIPFANLSQLYAVIEVLQESTAVARLVRPLLLAPREETEERKQGQQGVGVSFSHDRTLGLRLVTTLVHMEKESAWHLDAVVSRAGAQPDSSSGWTVKATVSDMFSLDTCTLSAEDLESAARDLDEWPRGLWSATERLVRAARVCVGFDSSHEDSMEIDDVKPVAAVEESHKDASPKAPTQRTAQSRKSPSRRRSSQSPTQGMSTRRRSQQASASPKIDQPQGRSTRRSVGGAGEGSGTGTGTGTGTTPGSRPSSPVEGRDNGGGASGRSQQSPPSRRRRSASGKAGS